MFFNDPESRMKRAFYTMSLLFAGVVFIGGCTYDKEELLNPPNNNQNPCSTVPASFNANILPLVITKCRIPGCHDATASGGHFFQTYDDVFAAKDMIRQRVVIEKSMPPTGPLPQADIDKLKCWIENGAPNN
jgi:hypothetical protein